MSDFLGRKECFSPDNIKKIAVEKKLTSIANIERALFALEYIGQLWNNGLDLVFKGGSAVQILLGDKWNRLSVDVDICTESSVGEIEKHLEDIKKKFDGKCFEFETRGGPDVDMFQCYRVTTLPITDIARKFLLDIQRVKPKYTLTNTPLKSFFYDSDINIKTPTGSSILGDKMSVIGPSTIGRKLDDSRNGIEYAKHFYDIFCLSNNFHETSETRKTYESCVEIQSQLRGKDFTRELCIEDAIQTCKIASLPYDENLARELVPDNEIFNKYVTLKKGVNGFSPFMVGERFYNWESFREYASKTAIMFKEMDKKKKQENQGTIESEEMIEALKGLPKKERWFMDFDDLRLSQKVTHNWYQFYAPEI